MRPEASPRGGPQRSGSRPLPVTGVCAGAEGTPCPGDRFRGNGRCKQGAASSRRGREPASCCPWRRSPWASVLPPSLWSWGTWKRRFPSYGCLSFVHSWRSVLLGAFLVAPRGWVTPRAWPHHALFSACNMCDHKATASITWVAQRLGRRHASSFPWTAGLRLYPFLSVTGRQDEMTGGKKELLTSFKKL